MPANPFNNFSEFGIGIGQRVPYYRHILEKKTVVDWFEIISENFMVDGGRPLEVLDQILEQCASYSTAWRRISPRSIERHDTEIISHTRSILSTTLSTGVRFCGHFREYGIRLFGPFYLGGSHQNRRGGMSILRRYSMPLRRSTN